MADLQEHSVKNVFVDNSVQNLNAAQEAGISTVLFNRDDEVYSGDIMNNFHELDSLLKNVFLNYKYQLFKKNKTEI
ncbi:MAG: hypothetical protein HFI51_01145 [Lachnospiraceae bacterium]|mgnify:CR=1 FL=1|nr:hypothetical protein [Lachnospiraceae bacterium]